MSFRVNDRVVAWTYFNRVIGTITDIVDDGETAIIQGRDLFGEITVRYPVAHLEHAACDSGAK